MHDFTASLVLVDWAGSYEKDAMWYLADVRGQGGHVWPGKNGHESLVDNLSRLDFSGRCSQVSKSVDNSQIPANKEGVC